MVDGPKERVAFLTGEAAGVPSEWMNMLEQEVWPPLRYDAWNQLMEETPPDVVFVMADMFDRHAPRDAPFAQAMAGTRWVAVLPDPDADTMLRSIRDGYHEVLDPFSSPALCLGPVLRLRELRGASETAQRLLEESLGAYEDLRWLDRIRLSLRVLDLRDLAARLVQEFAAALGESGGYLWRPGGEPGKTGTLELVHPVSGPPPATGKELSLHAIPRSAELIKGDPVLVGWHGEYTVFVPLVESGMLLAVIQVPRSEGRSNLLHREEGRVRMLMDWMGIALRNSLETEQLRSVLRTRYGDSFPRDAFEQHVEKALLQATRYRRPTSLVGLEYTGSAKNRKRVFELLLEALRDADVFEQPDGDRARIFLPETGYLGAVQFLRRLDRELLQKLPQPEGLKLRAAVASYPDHGESAHDLTAAVQAQLARAERVEEAFGAIRRGNVADFPGILDGLEGVRRFDDPNVWADLAFHLVQEASVVNPAETRMVLYLGDYRESSKTFASLFEYPARWDRILVAAGLDDSAPVPDSHLIRLVREPAMLGTYMALLERPRGSVGVWVRAVDDGWEGGVVTETQLIRAAINRFEDQFMLHQRWVAA